MMVDHVNYRGRSLLMFPDASIIKTLLSPPTCIVHGSDFPSEKFAALPESPSKQFNRQEWCDAIWAEIPDAYRLAIDGAMAMTFEELLTSTSGGNITVLGLVEGSGAV